LSSQIRPRPRSPPAETTAGLARELKSARQLLTTTQSSLGVRAGCQLWENFFADSALSRDEFGEYKRSLIAQGRGFCNVTAAQCREKIAELAVGFLRDDCTVSGGVTGTQEGDLGGTGGGRFAARQSRERRTGCPEAEEEESHWGGGARRKAVHAPGGVKQDTGGTVWAVLPPGCASRLLDDKTPSPPLSELLAAPLASSCPGSGVC
jgi:hypothetical protein